MARAKKERPQDPDRLVRRSAGDLHTEDGRFEVGSGGGGGHWYVTDTERHDGLGLALVLGPFSTLDQVREAIATQRATPAGGDEPLPEPTAPAPPGDGRPRRGRGRGSDVRPASPEPAPGPPSPGPTQPMEPEVPPPPPARVTHARWRARHDDRDEVVAIVRRIDDAWLSGDPAAMSDDLHPSVVLLPSEPVKRVEGREEAVRGYRSIPSDAVIVAWTETDLAVDVVGSSAVIGYRFELEWTADGAVHRDGGRDLFVLTNEHGRWLLAWRTSLPG
jgi:hypothetical protein